ncbi:MAG TPA: alpha/beta fold hydrolase [Jatrophihabitantaceae bacterium]
MFAGPTLRVHEPRTPPRAVVLVLHGGKARSEVPTAPWNGAVLRMIPFARTVARYDGVVVARLRYRVRGWNGAARSPVADTRDALDELRRRYPDRPVALIGHSMGGRTALYVADEPGVRAVVALAPWIEQYDRVEPLTGRRLLIAHGDRDRITDPAASAAFARRAAEVADVSYVQVRSSEHTMLRRAPLWHELAAAFAVAAVIDGRPVGTDHVTNVVHRALAGEASLVV